MYKFRIEKELKPFITRVLMRGYYGCTINKATDAPDSVYCITNAEPETFQKLYYRAACEKLFCLEGIVFVTEEEYRNGIVRGEILRYHGKHSCCILHEDDEENKEFYLSGERAARAIWVV